MSASRATRGRAQPFGGIGEKRERLEIDRRGRDRVAEDALGGGRVAGEYSARP